MNPMKRTPQIDPEWYRKSTQNRSGGRFLNTSGSEEQGKTTRNVAIDMAMDHCVEEKDEELESEVQPAVPGGGGRWEAGLERGRALTADCASLSRSSSFSSMQRSIAISIATFRVVFPYSVDISIGFRNKRRSVLSSLPCGRPRP